MRMDTPLKRICVFCGSSLGAHLDYREKVRELGSVLAESAVTLVYGGGSVGLMGELARSVLARQGEVRHSVADLRRAREVLGYEVEVPVVEGLRRTVAWYRERAGADAREPAGPA